MRRKLRPYEETHKLIDGVMYKLCTDCEDWHPLNEDYFYKNKSAPDGFNPYCKQATIERSIKRQKENPERVKEYTKEIYKRKPQYFKDKYNRWLSENEERAKELQKEWRQNNPNKLREYQIERNMHKTHTISDEELEELYQHANHSCMYCGISESEAINTYNQRLHKDHAYNNGSNGINNCILACKSCNSSKHDKDWDEWYIPNNPKYTYERYIKIEDWLGKFTV